MKMRSLALAASLAAILAAPNVLADDTQATMDAMRTVRDKDSGKLRAPTQEELKDLLDAEKAARRASGIAEPSADAQPVRVRTYASGMKSAVLGPDYLVTVQARRDASGNLVMSHANPAYEHAAPSTELPTK